MSNVTNGAVDVERAWTDADYRQSLSPKQLAQVPAHPAGSAELDDQELDMVSGGVNAFAAKVTARFSSCPSPLATKLSTGG